MNEISIQLSDDQSDRRLEEILSRVTCIGPEPMPSIDELASYVSDIVHEVRRDRNDEIGQQNRG